MSSSLGLPGLAGLEEGQKTLLNFLGPDSCFTWAGAALEGSSFRAPAVMVRSDSKP